MPFESFITRSPANGMEMPLWLWKIVGKVGGVDATSRSAELAKQLLQSSLVIQLSRWCKGIFIAWSALLRMRTFMLIQLRRWEYKIRCYWGERQNKKLRESGNLIYRKATRACEQRGTIMGVLAKALYLKNLECCLMLMLIFTSQLCMRVEEVKKLIAKLFVQSTLLLISIFIFNSSTRCSSQLIDMQISWLFWSILLNLEKFGFL